MSKSAEKIETFLTQPMRRHRLKRLSGASRSVSFGDQNCLFLIEDANACPRYQLEQLWGGATLTNDKISGLRMSPTKGAYLLCDHENSRW
jgi:hypothetical protein